MAFITVLSRLGVCSDGPAVVGDDGHEPISLTQGAADGACGLYCVLMSLALTGVESVESIRGFANAHGRTALGKLKKRFANETIFRGTDVRGLDKALVESYGSKVRTAASKTTGDDVVAFVLGQIAMDRPTILGVAGEDLAHWVVVVGLWNGGESDRYLLALDPSKPASAHCPWNVTVALNWTGDDAWPHLYGDHDHAQVEHALGLWSPA